MIPEKSVSNEDNSQKPFVGKKQPLIPTPSVFKPISIIPPPTNEPVGESKCSFSTHNSQMDFYKREYIRLLQENQLLRTHIAKNCREKQELQNKFNALNLEKSENQQKKKRFRRVASEIVREYVCPLAKCDKSYGTDASLVQHIKLKHNQYYVTPQYNTYIEQIRNKPVQNKQRTPLESLNTNLNHQNRQELI